MTTSGNEFDLVAAQPVASVPGGYVPSPSERVADQVARYEATGGADGGELGGLPVVILTTTGALNPNYARYRASSGRDIPVLALEPAERPER
jgi:hypothetical protein